MIIYKNSTNELVFDLAQYFNNTVLTDMTAIEITFGINKMQVRKLWYSYNSMESTAIVMRTQKLLKVKLTPQDTAQWQYQIPVQIRIKSKTNKITSGDVFYIYIQEALSSEDF